MENNINETEVKAAATKDADKIKDSDNIFKRIARAMGDITPIIKGKHNGEQDFNYRGVDDVMNGTQPILKKHGIFVIPELIDLQRDKLSKTGGGGLIHSIVKMRYTFYGKDGSSVAAVVSGEGMDTGDKSLTKAQSVAFRIALCQVFCIPTRDGVADPDAESYKFDAARPAPQQPRQQQQNQNATYAPKPSKGSNWTILKETIKGTKIGMPEVVEMSKARYQTERLNNLTPEQLADFIGAIKAKAAE